MAGSSPTEFRAVLIDPPWPERGAGRIKRGADRHYDLLNLDDIPRVVWSCPLFRPADDSHLYLWTTNNYLLRAGAMMSYLEFRYVTLITWPKPRPGIGQYFRGQTEHLMFGVRGHGFAAKTDRKDLTTLLPVWEHPERRHSAKPPSAHELIEARSRGPYLEMFARSTRPGWTSWGNEVTM